MKVIKIKYINIHTSCHLQFDECCVEFGIDLDANQMFWIYVRFESLIQGWYIW